MDFWFLGEVMSKIGNKKLLCSIETMSMFVFRDPIQYDTSETVVMGLFQRLFVPNGLPLLVIVNRGGTFK